MSAGEQRPPLVQMRGIVKRFGPVAAVSSVDLTLRRGELHALLGENGAGKTTLTSVLGGLLEPDAGEILIDGEPVRVRSARRAAELGIGVVHQHFMLINRFTVAENLQVGALESRKVSEWRDYALAAAHGIGVEIEPDALVSDLTVDQQQTVEILRALSRGAEILILDEPTAVLTPQESDHLFATLRRLAEGGKAVVFITHKLREVVGHADRITVMRGGEVVGNLGSGEADEDQLARLMVGAGRGGAEADAASVAERPPVAGPVAMSCSGVTLTDVHGQRVLDDLSLRIGAGEIVGVAGVAGNGQHELAEVLGGLRAIDAGTIECPDGELPPGNPLAFVRAGVGHVPEDRNGTALAPRRSIWENAVLKTYRRPPVARHGMVSRAAGQRFAEDLCVAGKVSMPGVGHPVRSLSGGNAQRLVLARELLCAQRLLIAAHPTRGLDVAASADVRRALLNAREEGVGVLLISADLDEIIDASDRVVVMCEGRITAEFERRDADRGKIGLAMGGAPEGVVP